MHWEIWSILLFLVIVLSGSIIQAWRHHQKAQVVRYARRVAMDVLYDQGIAAERLELFAASGYEDYVSFMVVNPRREGVHDDGAGDIFSPGIIAAMRDDGRVHAVGEYSNLVITLAKEA